MRFILDFLLAVWQLPQNIAGAVITCILFIRDINTVYTSDGIVLTTHFFDSAVSLGHFIIGELDSFGVEDYRHENGHRMQSRILGPLYLPVVGIVSLARNIMDRLFHRNWTYERRCEWYYGGFPEKWADRLGGVDRWQ